MGLMLRPGVSYCEVAGRLIFLDLEADRYFCLGRRAEAAFRAATAGLAEAGEQDDALLSLTQSGMLISTSDDSRPSACRGLEMPETSLLDDIRAGAPVSLRIAALRDLATTHFALRWRPLNVVLRRLAQQKSRAATRLSTERVTAQAVAAAFDWSSAIVRSHGRCLPRSIAVAQRLARLGISADLVVGVSLYPFAAHSWVQCSSALVNDRLDGVRHFTPILVI
ncbi:lasso peptide biosynthesis B2 protein [Sandaracinobacter neustonicus]|uniref:Lasso peptide biosynthesis B2 protein n=1 Tax=Sandaracinobacter neustonicus TaxID=1715348 RepID=A0A501XPH7_9SPHN|nr:lasso peptide biosynthesis B2 protein [Sandaracinobacter neustonicus]TPE62602.1 lasso peptide biosynthesis B2 protein [Sandaracinobacter neustonicus]